MSQNWLRKALFSLCTTGLFLYGTEVVLRRIYGPIEQDVHIYSGVGSYEQWLVEVGDEVRPVYMHQPLSFPQESRYHRLAFLGGSTVHGGTPTATMQEEFPNLVGAKLKMRPWNLGSPSLDSHDVLRIVQDLKKYRFDAWVIYTGHNDFGNAYFYQRFSSWEARQQVAWDSFFRRFQLYRLLRVLRKEIPIGNGERIGKSDMSGALIDAEQKEVALQLLLENVERIIWEAQIANVSLLFVIPTSSWLKPPLGRCVPQQQCALDSYQEGMKTMSSTPKKARDYLSMACAEDGIPLRILPQAQEALRALFIRRGVPYIDAHQDLPRQTGIDLPAEDLFYDHVHFSNRGHEEMANLIANKLSTMWE